MTERQAENRAKKYLELKAKIEEETRELEEIKKELQAYMDATKKEEKEVGDFKIFWKLTRSMKFSSTAFKAEMPELYDKYKVEAISTYFKVNKRKGA